VLSLETRDIAIFVMAKLAESRDPETGAHLERVRSYSRVIAQHLGGLEKFRKTITPEYARLIYLTSPLHDIGKVGIPDMVLLKPGRLSDREFEIMKTHTTIGAQTLDAALAEFPNVDFLKMGRDIAASHHERFDGAGYPNGLAGEAIPLCGRIVALADVYDALTSRRVYKSAYTHNIAREMIISEIGSHFDPDVVDAFVHNESQFVATREHFDESNLQRAA
jgi:putative two-component system response regulator